MEMKTVIQLNVIVLVGIVCVQFTDCLKCYQCNSNTDDYCTERMDFNNFPLEPEECDKVHAAKCCITTTGMFKGEVGTQRFCSSRDLGTICQMVQRKGDRREYRSCVRTCCSDGCNS